MKYLKEYSEEEIKDLESDLRSVGLSEWTGFYITCIVDGNDAIDASSMIVVGHSLEGIAQLLFEVFGIDDPEEAGIFPQELTSIKEILESIENFWTSGMGSDWNSFKYEVWEMSPKNLTNALEKKDLIDMGKCLEMGRRYFSDFDSVILKPSL